MYFEVTGTCRSRQKPAQQSGYSVFERSASKLLNSHASRHCALPHTTHTAAAAAAATTNAVIVDGG